MVVAARGHGFTSIVDEKAPYGPCSNYRVKTMDSDRLTIGHLAKGTATKVETIRYYERIGLLPAPTRTEGNYRSYGRPHLQRLSFIRRARGLGFSIEQVRELLSLADDRTRPCDAVDGIAHAHLAEVKRKLADLAVLRRELEQLLGQCRSGTIAECRIIQALADARRDGPT
jgi:Cu(I)-responsive transcriptional regulator